ncbi:MAG: hypothetical protein EXR60_04625 [Dehalococcoidia bacterium]|nr:hypothetical protein [Dehalococcoidia bacterium]
MRSAPVLRPGEIGRQNTFDLPGSVGNLSGRPDVVAVTGTSGIIVDAKTARPSPEHQAQVMIYMWALPQTQRWKGIRFDGLLVYPDRRIPIAQNAIDDQFITGLRTLIRRVGALAPAVKVPSLR